MADNVTLDVMSGGDSIGADDISSVKYQRIKLIYGADGVNSGDVSSANPFPVILKANSGVDVGDVDVMSVPADPFGANADAAVVAGATGSIQAKLRSISRDLVANIVLAAGANAIGKLAANSGVDIGDVDVVTLPGINGSIAHDSADSGNPVKIGFIAYSPDGTTPGTAVAELDRTNGKADLDGRQFVNEEHPRAWSYHVNGSSALTDASVAADPGDGFQLVITEIIFSLGAASAINMFLEEGSTTIFGPIYLEAINGRGFVWRGKKRVTASTALTITTSASVAHSVDMQGYIQAV